MKLKAGRAKHDWTVGGGQVRVSFWILLISSLAITKIGVFCWNHAIQVPLVNWINDRSLYPQDPYMAVLARYPFGMWSIVALLARLFPLEGLLLVLFVLERLFVLYAVSRLARAFAPRSGLAVVAATALFAFGLESMIGDGTIVALSFEHTMLATACILLGGAAFYERRPVDTAVWLGIGFELTPMYGVFALSYFGAVFVLDAEYRGEWKRWVRPFLLFLALSSYAVYLSLVVTRGQSAVDPSWFTAALARGSAHLYPWTWGLEPFARFGVFIALLAAVTFFVRREEPRLFRHGVIWSAVAVAWLLDAIAAAYVWHSPRLMMMQPVRAIDLLVCFGGIAMVSVAASKLDQYPAPSGRQAWLLALGASFAVWLVPGMRAVAVVLVIAALPPVWRRLAPSVSPRRLAGLLVAWVVVAGVNVAHVRWTESADVKQVVVRGPDVPTRERAAWAEKHTPLDAVFLLNASAEPDFDEFRALAKRSIFTSTNEGAGIYWAPEFVLEWTRRLNALGVKIEYRNVDSLDDDFDAAFTNLDDDHVLRLKEQYRVSHWVVPGAHLSRFPVVWEGEEFKVLEVR